MVIIHTETRKFIAHFHYSPAGVSKYTIGKAAAMIEKLHLSGDLSFRRVQEIISNVKSAAKPFGKPTKYTRRPTTCTLQEEVIVDGQVELITVADVKAVNDSLEAFTKDYGRTISFKKAFFAAVANLESGISIDDLHFFEDAWKAQLPKSANTWDAIDNEYVANIVASEIAQKESLVNAG